MVDIKSVFDGENGLSKGSAVDAVFVSDDKVHILHILLTWLPCCYVCLVFSLVLVWEQMKYVCTLLNVA